MKRKIGEIEIELPTPYADGEREVGAAEKTALDKAMATMILNSLRRNPDLEGADAKAFQKAANALVKDFDFARTRTASSKTPLEIEATKIARKLFAARCKESGITVKDWVEENGRDAYNAKISEFASNENVQKVAADYLERAAEEAAILAGVGG